MRLFKIYISIEEFDKSKILVKITKLTEPNLSATNNFEIFIFWIPIGFFLSLVFW